jgi:hypothetical protein
MKGEHVMKKIICLMLAVIMTFSMSVSAFAAEIDANDEVSLIDNSIEEIDALLIASSMLNAPDIANDILVSGATENDVLPLYNASGEIVAYYVSFEPTGYAVVNNNIENPSVIEFGEGVNQLIDDILKVESNPHIIYNNPTEVYSANVNARSVNTNSDLYTYYPILEEANYAAVAQLAQLRQFVQSDVSVCSDGDYGFIDWGDMPSGTYNWDMVANAASTDWATTGEFSSIASNHCGATAVTNFALYFANCGYSNLKINSSVYDTFVAVHNIVGNGPVMTIADEAKEYFTDRGYTLKTSSVGSFSGIQTAIGNDRPCGILLANAIVDWHWVICVGYRAYNSGGSYMRVVDGWNDTTLKFYLCNSGSTWISATQYWVA